MNELDQNFLLLKQKLIEDIRSLSGNTPEEQTNFIHMTENCQSPLLLSSLDLKNKEVIEKIEDHKIIDVEFFVEILFSVASKEEKQEEQNKLILIQTREQFDFMKSKLIELLDQTKSRFLNFVSHDQISAKNFLIDFANGVFYHSEKKDKILRDIVKYLSKSYAGYYDCNETIKQFMSEIHSQLKNSIQKMTNELIFSNKFNENKNDIQENIFPCPNTPVKFNSMSSSLTGISKGIAVNPQEKGKYAFLDKSGLFKSFSILTASLTSQEISYKVLFEKKMINTTLSGGEGSIDYSPSGSKILISNYEENSVTICKSSQSLFSKFILQEINEVHGVMHARWATEESIVVGDFEGTIKYFDIKQASSKPTPKTFRFSIHTVRFILPLGLDTIDKDKKMNENKKIEKSLANDSKNLEILYGNDGGSLIKLDLNTMKVVWVQEKLHKFSIFYIAKKENYIATGSDDKSLCVMNELNKEIIYKLKILTDCVIYLSFAPYANYIVAVTGDEIITINFQYKKIINKMHIERLRCQSITSCAIDWELSCLLFGAINGALFRLNMF